MIYRDMYEGVSLTDLDKLLQKCELKLAQTFDSYVLIGIDNGVEIYNSELLTDIYIYCVGYLIDVTR